MASEVATNLEASVEMGGQGMNRGYSRYFDVCVGTKFANALISRRTLIIITSC